MQDTQDRTSLRCYAWLAALVVVLPLVTPLHGEADPTVARLLESLKNNVVSITATRSDGSEHQGFGFLVGEDRGLLFIVTANHVVRGDGPEGRSTRVTLKYFYDQGTTYQAKLSGTSSSERDLAVLTAQVPAGFTWRRDAIGSEEQVEWGTDVWFIGRNGRWDAPAIAGKVTEVNLSDQIVVDNLPVQPGTSGAPLISQNGIVGMIVSDAPGDVSRSLTIGFIHKALKQWNHLWDLKPLGTKPSHTTSTPTPLTPTPPPVSVVPPLTPAPSPGATGKLCLRLSRDMNTLVEFIVSSPDKGSSVVLANDCADLKPGKYDIKLTTFSDADCQSTTAEVKAGKMNTVQVWCGLPRQFR